MVTPAIFIGALSGKATGMASMRRTISGACSTRAAGDRCVFSNTARTSGALRLDVRGFDDRRPLVHLGAMECAEALRRRLLGGWHFLAHFGEALLHRRIGECTCDRGVQLRDDVLGRALRRPNALPNRDVES